MTDSEWDNCNFAVIHITEDWKQTQKARLKVTKLLKNDNDLKWLNYADTNIEFIRFSSEQCPHIEHCLSENSRFYIDLESDNLRNLFQPDNNLNCYQMQVYKNGNAIYNAFGTHTGEEFWTEQFSLETLIL